jgi:hypothetical protein
MEKREPLVDFMD